jgi:hypothetical protein
MVKHEFIPLGLDTDDVFTDNTDAVAASDTAGYGAFKALATTVTEA